MNPESSSRDPQAEEYAGEPMKYCPHQADQDAPCSECSRPTPEPSEAWRCADCGCGYPCPCRIEADEAHVEALGGSPQPPAGEESTSESGPAPSSSPEEDAVGVWWLIEWPQSGGALWWGGEARYWEYWDEVWRRDSGRCDRADLYPFMTQDANKAIRFRSKEDAESVMRLMPESWREKGLVSTDHRWMSNAWRGEETTGEDRPPPAGDPPWIDLETVLRAAEMAWERQEDTVPEEGSALHNVRQWLALRGGLASPNSEVSD